MCSFTPEEERAAALLLVHVGVLSEAELSAALADYTGSPEMSMLEFLRERGAIRAAVAEAARVLEAEARRGRLSTPAETIAPPDQGNSKSESARLEPGHWFGDYYISAELGRGAMGVVYRARHREEPGDVALKVLPASSMLTDTDRARFDREARAVASLSHRNIIPVHDIGCIDDIEYIAMELVEGVTLRDLASAQRLAPDRAARLISKAAEGLWHAHQRGVIHRDVKPANIMVTRDDRVYVVDFGLAFERSDPTLTTTGALVGTPMYMAPERLMGARDKVGPASDVYSLGATLYETVCGRPPYDGDDNYDIIRRILYETAADIRDVYPGAPERLVVIIERAMAKDIRARHRTAYELAQDLQRFALQMKIDRVDSLRASRLARRKKRSAHRR